MDIDFSEYTDQQLVIAAKYAEDPEHIEAILFEQDKREGTSDGSTERVAALYASSRR